MVKIAIKNRFIPLSKKLIYVVGVSGGPDSMFLLDRMRKLNYNFVVAHVNYRKREDSNIDELITRDYCKKYQISFFSKQVRYENFNEKNFQAFARKIRYDFFSELCKKVLSKSPGNDGVAIAVAHNLEDLIETFYIQKKRDSFVNFWGLSFESSWSSFKVYRPLLKFLKSSILKYLKKENIGYATDYTNEKEIYLRNYFRKKIMPMSEEEKSNLLLEINERNDFLLRELKHFDSAYQKVISENILRFNSDWNQFSVLLKKRIIYRWINVFSNNAFSSRKKNIISELLKQFSSSSENVIFNFRNGFIIEKNKSSAFITKI